MAFSLKNLIGRSNDSEEYIEMDFNNSKDSSHKVVVKPFFLRSFDDITEILNALREGYTIAVIDIKPLKSKDVIELKRAIAKIKKTVEANEGSIKGFGENMIIATPSFAEIHNAPVSKEPIRPNKPANY